MIGHLFGFIKWWYSGGLVKLFNFLGALLFSILNNFSIKTTVLNLFSPWKRVLGVKRPGLDGIKDWLVDNLVSRTVGFFLRLVLLFVAFLVLSFYAVFAVLAIILWLLYPAFVLFILFMILSGALL